MDIVYAATSSVPQSLSGLTDSFNRYVVWFQQLFWAVVVVYFIWAAFTFLRADGDPDKVETAKKMVLYGVIAACVALLATGIKDIVTNLLNAK